MPASNAAIRSATSQRGRSSPADTRRRVDHQVERDAPRPARAVPAARGAAARERENAPQGSGGAGYGWHAMPFLAGTGVARAPVVTATGAFSWER
jgi:hypothetical protein